MGRCTQNPKENHMTQCCGMASSGGHRWLWALGHSRDQEKSPGEGLLGSVHLWLYRNNLPGLVFLNEGGNL